MVMLCYYELTNYDKRAGGTVLVICIGFNYVVLS
jgi:hypothetical protein